MNAPNGLILRPYAVTVDGFAPITYYARSPGEARSQAWKAYGILDDRCTFRDFLKISSLRRTKPAPEFGRKILVSGRPAFRVPLVNPGRNVGFVYPGEWIVLHSHPNDVEEEEWT